MSNRSTVAAYYPLLTGTGNRNPDDVTQMSVEAASHKLGITKEVNLLGYNKCGY